MGPRRDIPKIACLVSFPLTQPRAPGGSVDGIGPRREIRAERRRPERPRQVGGAGEGRALLRHERRGERLGRADRERRRGGGTGPGREYAPGQFRQSAEVETRAGARTGFEERQPGRGQPGGARAVQEDVSGA